jgi:hypothetical protein
VGVNAIVASRGTTVHKNSYSLTGTDGSVQRPSVAVDRRTLLLKQSQDLQPCYVTSSSSKTHVPSITSSTPADPQAYVLDQPAVSQVKVLNVHVFPVGSTDPLTPHDTTAQRRVRGRRGKNTSGITDLQNDFCDSKSDNVYEKRAKQKYRATSKQYRVDVKNFANRGFRGKVASSSSKAWKKAGVTRLEQKQFVAKKARLRRVQLGLEGVSKSVSRRRSRAARGDTDISINLKAAVRQFQRTGALPHCSITIVRDADTTGVDSQALKRMINTMLVRAGLEINPGPVYCPDCGASFKSSAERDAHLKKGKCVKWVKKARSATEETHVGRSNKTDRTSPCRSKAGRAGGTQRLLESAVSLMADQAAGAAIARQEHRREAADVREDAKAKKDEGPKQLQGLIPAPKTVFYRIGEFSKEINDELRPKRFVQTVLLIVFSALLLSMTVHIVTTGWNQNIPLFGGNFLLRWMVNVVSIMAIGILSVGFMRRPEMITIEVVDDHGYYTDLDQEEIALRSDINGQYNFSGRFVSFTNWRPTQGAVQFASPDRLDTKVMCVPNLWTVARREVYPLHGRLVDRTVDLHISGTLVNAISAERFGMLRGKTYEEGRRILQLYADTQNHTQIDLTWNLVGEPTSLAENVVEYLCALRMMEAGDSTRLKGVEARCFQ